MYKLTSCGTCGSDIFAIHGCCGQERTVIFKCPCGEKYLNKLEQEKKK